MALPARLHLKRQREGADPSIATDLAGALASTSTSSRRRRRPRPSSTSIPSSTTRRRPATTTDVPISDPSSSSSSVVIVLTSNTLASSTSSPVPSSSSVASSTSVSAAAQSASSGELPAPVRTAVIASSVSVGSAILLAILFFCLCKRRKASSGSQGPSPLIGSLEDDDRKSFAEYSHQGSEYPAAVNAWDGRPLSFLNNVQSTLQASHAADMSQVGPSGAALARSTVDDPFRFGFGKGSHALTAALAGDLATARGPHLQSQARAEEVLRDADEPDRVQHPYSEGSFSRQKSVRFNPQPHPYGPGPGPAAHREDDPRHSQFVDSYSDASSGRESQPYR